MQVTDLPGLSALTCNIHFTASLLSSQGHWSWKCLLTCRRSLHSPEPFLLPSLYSVPVPSLSSSLTCKNFSALCFEICQAACFVSSGLKPHLPRSDFILMSTLVTTGQAPPIEVILQASSLSTLGTELCSQPPGLALMWTTSLSSFQKLRQCLLPE